MIVWKGRKKQLHSILHLLRNDHVSLHPSISSCCTPHPLPWMLQPRKTPLCLPSLHRPRRRDDLNPNPHLSATPDSWQDDRTIPFWTPRCTASGSWGRSILVDSWSSATSRRFHGWTGTRRGERRRGKHRRKARGEERTFNRGLNVLLENLNRDLNVFSQYCSYVSSFTTREPLNTRLLGRKRHKQQKNCNWLN